MKWYYGGKLASVVLGVCCVVVFGASALKAQTGPATSSASWMLPLEKADRALPPWLQFNGEYRDRFEAPEGISFKKLHDRYLLNRIRLGVVIAPTKWLRFVGLAQDSRIFLNDYRTAVPPYQNTWDIREAYVQVGSTTEGWGDGKLGRQVLAFGDERLIGPSDWLNMGRTFDAVRVDLHANGNQVSLFSSSAIFARDGVIDHHLQGNNLHGMYTSLKSVVPKAALEPYVLWRVAPAGVRLSENAGRGALNEVTLGLRFAGNLPGSFDYNLEMAKQIGSLGPDSISTWAGHWNVGRSFVNTVLRPRVFMESNYASGTKNPKSRDWGTFDQLYPSAHDKLGFADQVGWRNVKQIRAGVEEAVARKWKLRQTYENFWLASTHDNLYGTNGGVAVTTPTTRAVPSHVGQEFDLIGEYSWLKGDVFGFGYAKFVTGPFLDAVTPGKNFDYPYVYLSFRF